MPTHDFIVSVDIERDSGLHASRDDINERLEDAITEAVENADLSGLGPTSESEYSYSSVSVDAVDTRTKAGRDALMEYDSHVIQDLPGDEKVRQENRRLRDELKQLNKVLAEVKDRNIRLQEALDTKRTEEETRIFQESGYPDYIRNFIPDGRHDDVKFRVGSHEEDIISVELDVENRAIKIKNSGMRAQMAVVPTAANTIRVALLPEELGRTLGAW